jgi:crotonobetaine/carnitine-CoA ligase
VNVRRQSAPVVFEERAQSDPSRVFVQEADGARRVLTYGETVTDARRWAGAFARLGVRAGEPVGTILRSGVDAVSCWLGLGWLRACDAGIHPEYRGTTLRRLLDTVRPAVVVVQDEYAGAVREVVDTAEYLRTVVVLGESPVAQWPPHVRVLSVGEFLDGAAECGLSAPERHDVACVVFTSGTTGPSKAVRIPWGNFWSTLPVWSDLTERDAFYSPFPMCHAAGRSPLTWIGVPGGRWVVRTSFRTSAFWSDIAEFGCTTTQLIPAMVSWIRQTARHVDVRSGTLEKIVTAPLSNDVLELRELLGLRVRTVYGMSEIGMAISRFVDDGDVESSGRPTAGYEVRVVDEYDNEVGVDEVGELVVRTDAPWSLNCGYLNMPEQTADAWRNGWFHTGDGLRRRADGEYVFVDRLKDSLRRRGENVSSFELEEVFLSHPAVAECAAVGIDAAGDEQDIKVCVVLARASITERELVEHVAAHVPSFMVPRYVEIVGSLPRTDVTNRVTKNLLRDEGVTASTWDRLAT